MAKAPEARYLADLRAELEPMGWFVFKRAEPTRRKAVTASTRFEALCEVAERNRIEIELLDAEVAR